jgi:hypothetical protein
MIELKILDSGDIQFSVTDQEAFNRNFGNVYAYENREREALESLCEVDGLMFYSSGDDCGLMFSGPVIVDGFGDRLWYDNYYAVRDAVDELLQGHSVVYTLYKE